MLCGQPGCALGEVHPAWAQRHRQKPFWGRHRVSLWGGRAPTRRDRPARILRQPNLRPHPGPPWLAPSGRWACEDGSWPWTPIKHATPHARSRVFRRNSRSMTRNSRSMTRKTRVFTRNKWASTAFSKPNTSPGGPHNPRPGAAFLIETLGTVPSRPILRLAPCVKTRDRSGHRHRLQLWRATANGAVPGLGRRVMHGSAS